MPSTRITIINKLGLHARASAKLVATASGFSSRITLDRDGKTADAKSIMSVMMLAASQGTELLITTEGDDAAAALQAVCDLINDYFGEGE